MPASGWLAASLSKSCRHRRSESRCRHSGAALPCRRHSNGATLLCCLHGGATLLSAAWHGWAAAELGRWHGRAVPTTAVLAVVLNENGGAEVRCPAARLRIGHLCGHSSYRSPRLVVRLCDLAKSQHPASLVSAQLGAN